MLYSFITRGFYSPSVHGSNIPADAVAISQELYELLLDGQGQGKEIIADDDGNPVIADRVLTYQQELAAINTGWQSKVDGYNKAFALAALSDGPNEESKKAAIRAAYETDKQQNTADRAALKAKYGIGGV